MTEIVFNKEKHKFSKENNLFTISEKDVTFDTKYSMKNPKTGNSKLFEFKESTGCEFDPNTKWIYKSEDGITLEVCNDPAITKLREKSYLNHKLNRD